MLCLLQLSDVFIHTFIILGIETPVGAFVFVKIITNKKLLNISYRDMQCQIVLWTELDKI